MENQEIKQHIEIGKKRTTESDEEETLINPKRTKRDSIVKSEGEEDSKSVTSEQSKKSSNGSDSTPEPGSTPDEDASDLSDPQIGPNRENVTLFWFTEAALRMTDNPGLKAALQHCKAVRFCYFLDQRFVSMDSPRWKFIKSALNDIDEQLKKLGSRLHVLSGQPSEQLPVIFEQWNIVRLGFSSHPGCNESRLRDRAIVSLALRHGVEVVYREAPHCLYTPADVLKQCNGQVPLTFTSYCTTIKGMNAPTQSVSVPDSEIMMNSISDDHDEIEKNVCLLEKEDKDFPYRGGETEARARFARAMEHWRETGAKQPDLRAVTPYVIQGCLSAREIYNGVEAQFAEMNEGQSPGLAFHVAQLHRDYLYCLGSINKSDLTLDIAFDDNELGQKWRDGETGYPWVDACIRQMKTDGWAPPLLRQSALWFLTRGMLWQKPEIGVEFLSEHCLFDLALARGYVNWAAGVGAWIEDDVTAKCPKVSASYIRRWLPELNELSDEEIEKPWLIKQLPEGYAKMCVPHKQSHKQSQAKYQLSLTTESNKFLTRLDQIGRKRKVFQPVRLEPNPWEIVQSSQYTNNITGLSHDITQSPSFMQYVHKTQQNWNKMRAEQVTQ